MAAAAFAAFLPEFPLPAFCLPEAAAGAGSGLMTALLRGLSVIATGDDAPSSSVGSVSANWAQSGPQKMKQACWGGGGVQEFLSIPIEFEDKQLKIEDLLRVIAMILDVVWAPIT